MKRLADWLKYNAAAFFLMGMIDRRLAAIIAAAAFFLGAWLF